MCFVCDFLVMLHFSMRIFLHVDQVVSLINRDPKIIYSFAFMNHLRTRNYNQMVPKTIGLDAVKEQMVW